MSDVVEPGDIREEPFQKALGERYLSYALSTIMARSLPDVRDGLKPVHRRLVYAMRELGLNPAAACKKCARIVGDVMGKFHPHGDQAIYEALVRLAQGFAQRYPLIDGQGNFGNIDGDNAAAMRYTEARLTPIAEALLADIGADTVDFRPTYDGEEQEPLVLPAAFPNLLANGAAGIAVGMATAIPPHNAVEICDALLHLLKHPKATLASLLALLPGPDFPTGGVLVEPAAGIAEAYRTGRGGFRLRARWHVEHGKRGTYQIVVTEIPYQVAKARLVEKLAELLAEKKLPLLAEVRDESAEDIRLVLEPRSGKVLAELAVQHLFRLTDLEVRVPLNLNVLDAEQVPRVMTLVEVLQAFLTHRQVVLLRKSRHRLAEIARRLEILAGFLVVYLNLDEVIRIIRREDEPKPALMAAFKLSEMQAEAILNMRLRSLRKLEELEIRKEHKTLTSEQAELRQLLGDEKRQLARIGEELRELKKRLQADKALSARRTQLSEPTLAEDVPAEAFIEREPITVICSEKGWIRAVKGHLPEGPDARYKEGDRGRFWLHAETTDKLLLFATNGRFYTLPVDKLPGGRGQGEPIRLMLGLPNEADLVSLLVHSPDGRLLLAATDGRGFQVPEAQVLAQTRSGRQVLNVSGDTEALAVVRVSGDHVACLAQNRKLLLFALAEVPEMTRGRGVRLMKFKDGGLADIKTLMLSEGLGRQLAGRQRVEDRLDDWLGHRGQAGRLVPKGFPKGNRFA
ncbi:MAG: DNA topoisomerase IV subunit A [Alphaproteobacteria bacterium]|nr:DNA topoisomerase IV subunit A [Alphaproteobacteria bacterium]